jgi:UPF0176 protein
MVYRVASFYKFVQLPDYVEKQQAVLAYCQTQQIIGTILLAAEGINGSIWGTQGQIEAVLAFLRSDPRLADLDAKTVDQAQPPFDRLKVRLKKEIVTLGMPDVDPTQQVGTYVAPQDWNALITDPDVIVIDTRNTYEVSIGSFKGALNPETESFREFPDYVRAHLDPNKHRKVAMFCTGGIRCEKASAFMLSQGFQDVYHLEGGILKYLEDVPADQSLWQGECFVFDQRVTVEHGLTEGSYDLCVSCGQPISDADKASNDYEVGISCPHCFPTLTPEKRARQAEKKRQRALAKSRSSLPSQR